MWGGRAAERSVLRPCGQDAESTQRRRGDDSCLCRFWPQQASCLGAAAPPCSYQQPPTPEAVASPLPQTLSGCPVCSCSHSPAILSRRTLLYGSQLCLHLPQPQPQLVARVLCCEHLASTRDTLHWRTCQRYSCTWGGGLSPSAAAAVPPRPLPAAAQPLPVAPPGPRHPSTAALQMRPPACLWLPAGKEARQSCAELAQCEK